MPVELPQDLTPELVPISWLLGEWRGQGRLGAGEADSEHFVQEASFRSFGLPCIEYISRSWVSDEEGNKLRPLTEELGFWSLDRPLVEADGGPGMIPEDILPTYTTAEAVETLRNAEGGFDITATITHPGGMAELYYGTVKDAKIELNTDAVMRSVGSKPYAAATRIFGLVNGQLFWRWDVAGIETDDHEKSNPDEKPNSDEQSGADSRYIPHASGILSKVEAE